MFKFLWQHPGTPLVAEIQSNSSPGPGPLGFCPFLWDLIVFTCQSHLKPIAVPVGWFSSEQSRGGF